jgi:citrate lyase beta subunit
MTPWKTWRGLEQGAQDLGQAHRGKRVPKLAMARCWESQGTLADACRQQGVPALDKLAGKLTEEARDVRDAVREMQEGVAQSRGKFSG